MKKSTKLRREDPLTYHMSFDHLDLTSIFAEQKANKTSHDFQISFSEYMNPPDPLEDSRGSGLLE